MPRARISKATKDRRGVVDDSLRVELKDFMKSATAEEKHFLLDVLIARHSLYAEDGGEIAIAGAFDLEIGRGERHYIMVPDGINERMVKDFIEQCANPAFEPQGGGWLLWKKTA